MATALVDLYGGQPIPFDRIILAEGYRPSEDDEFMCDLHRAYFLRKLKDWKEEVIEESRQTMAQLQVDSLREPDLSRDTVPRRVFFTRRTECCERFARCWHWEYSLAFRRWPRS